MVGFLAVVLTRVVTWLASLLPASPFAGIRLAQGLETGLGWLNWVVPVTDCITLMLAWLAALWAAVVIRWILDSTSKAVAKATGIG